jgi:hypothetical protein
MFRIAAMSIFAALTLWSTPGLAWLDGGHMQIAALAYIKLTPEAKAKVDALIQLNPDYPTWVNGLPADQAGLVAFVRASVWADDIKMTGPGYNNVRMQDHHYIFDGFSPPAKDPAAGQNIGYSDKLQHQYWHFKDIGFSSPEDGTEVAPDAINAASRIKLFKAALPSSSGATDDVRSYDLVWLIHLVGDAHQPLHAVKRYSKAEFPKGDNGGNAEMVTPATGEVLLLHFYWDRLLGGFVTPQSAVHDTMCDPNSPTSCRDGGLAKVQIDGAKASIDDPEVWFNESFELAKKFAYAEPVLSGSKPILLTRDYETQARNIALQQAALAAQRLANMLNEAFQ